MTRKENQYQEVYRQGFNELTFVFYRSSQDNKSIAIYDKKTLNVINCLLADDILQEQLEALCDYIYKAFKGGMFVPINKAVSFLVFSRKKEGEDK